MQEDPKADILILPELWLGPDEHLNGRYPEIMSFIRRKHEEGAYIYSACSGAGSSRDHDRPERGSSCR